jgi:hypothetical protein
MASLSKGQIGLVTSLAMLFGQSAMAQVPTPQDAQCATAVSSLSDTQVRQIIASDLYGNSDPSYANNVDLTFVARDKVTIAGKTYPLIFVGSDEGTQWNDLKSSLPPDLARGLAAPLTDQQLAVYVRGLAGQAEQRFLSIEVGAYGMYHERFAAQYPAGTPEETIRDSVMRAYETNDNGAIAPEAQAAYNQYAALASLSDALDLYNKYSVNELAASCQPGQPAPLRPPR